MILYFFKDPIAVWVGAYNIWSWVDGCPLTFGWGYRKPSPRKDKCVQFGNVYDNYLNNDDCKDRNQFICEIQSTYKSI